MRTVKVFRQSLFFVFSQNSHVWSEIFYNLDLYVLIEDTMPVVYL